jgi:hypothetical protein
MGSGGRRRRRGTGGERPIPLDPVELLAGLAPGVELHADDVPAGIDPEQATTTPAATTVAEIGKLVRAGEATVRRLIRTAVLRPASATPSEEPADVERAGVLPRTPDKPGE